MNYESWILAGHDLEYFDDIHQYLVDGVMVSSITQMLKFRFKNKYAGVDRLTLQRASERGTGVHRVIEEYCKHGTETDLKELRNFKFLKKQYKFRVLDNEIPVILFDNEEVIGAGRLDMVIEMDGLRGLGDIKCVSALDKEYLGLQLNLYRIAYTQTYGIDIDFLKGLHLRDDTRKFVDIPINDELTMQFIREYKEGNNESYRE
jgi:hypothetical protein